VHSTARHGTARHDIAQRCLCRAVPHESRCLAHSTVTHETALWTSSACCAAVAIVQSDSATPHRTAPRCDCAAQRDSGCAALHSGDVLLSATVQCNATQCNATEGMWSAEIHPFVQSSVQVTGRCSAAAHYAVGRPCEDWPHSGSRDFARSCTAQRRIPQLNLRVAVVRRGEQRCPALQPPQTQRFTGRCAA
jgi:hypothetical protein